MTKNIYQIQISLKDSKPRIWRRLLIPSDLLLSDFHKIIQTAMGWANVHLHQFIKNHIFYSVKLPEDDLWKYSDNIDYRKRKIRVSDLLSVEKEKITYEYDFGDDWVHDIILEKILPVDNKIKYPVCVKGKMNCPPEDCGGIWGYYDMLEVLKRPDNKDYESCTEWLEDDFDLEYFNIDDVNSLLRQKNYGCIEFL